MSKLPDFLIGTNDDRFAETWGTWTESIATEIENNPLTFRYFNNVSFEAYTNPPEIPSKQIPKDILKAVNFMANSLTINTCIIGYDSSYVPFDHLNQILLSYLYSRRRYDWSVNLITAFALTETLNTKLLNQFIPRLNFVAITYTRDF